MKENAFYHDQQLVEFMGNPLIEALPPMEDPARYPKLLMVLPDYSEEEREEDPAWRLACGHLSPILSSSGLIWQ